jgi:predicted flap endonuclease-1-like 5' DNA nuclease
MSKYLKPKTWYLFGVGVVALAVDGTRRIIKRRRQGEPVIAEEISETVETKTRQAQAKGVEIEDKIEELAEPVVKPAKKAAKEAKAKTEETGDKVEELAEPATKPVKKAASRSKAKIEATGEELEEKIEAVIERGEEVVAEAEVKAETRPEKVEARADELAEPVEETAAKAAKKAEAVPALEFVKARTGKNGSKAGQLKSDVAPDDLTEIKGIGPTFARRLIEAGITTFADVANASPDYLREVTHASAVAHPEEWIADAQNR